MENLDIQKLWKQNETILEETRKLNLSLLKEVKIDKAKSSLNNLLFLPITTLLFYSIIATYAIYFALINLDIWYFWFSGAVVVFFSIWLIISSIIQLKQILSINFSDTIVELQKNLIQIKISVVRNLRIVTWLLPFSPFVGIFTLKTLFGFDLMSLMNFNMLMSFGISTVILEIISLLLLKALRRKNINKKWLNWILQSSGSQVNEALQFLDDIENFETK